VSLSAAARAEIEKARDRYPQPRSAILPSLWAVQHEVGYVSDEGMQAVAEILGLAPSEVQAVSTFYSMYFDHPAGEHHILVCVNVACALRGADETVEYIERKLGCPSGSTTADGKFTWESTIECLGACGYAPMMQIDHHFHEHLTPERIDAILERVAAEPGHGGHRVTPAQTAPEQEPQAEAPPAKQPSRERSRQRRALRGDGEAK
jgi:NADH-quinone oxidoreductase subunit E